MNQAVLEAKKALVSEIQTKFSDAVSTVVVEYRGLSVIQMTELRRQLSAEGVELKIYKNKMASRAAEAAGYQDINEYLTGPNALAFGNDAVAPSRILTQFAKKNKKLILKSGIVEGNVVDASMIKELASLPNRDGMISMILGLFQAPVRNFAYALSQVAQTKDEGVEPSEATPEVVAEAPAKEVAVEEVVAEAPAKEVAVEEVVVEAPAKEVAVEEVVAEAPVKEVAKKAPVKKEVKEEVKEEVVTETTPEETKTEDQ